MFEGVVSFPHSVDKIFFVIFLENNVLSCIDKILAEETGREKEEIFMVFFSGYSRCYVCDLFLFGFSSTSLSFALMMTCLLVCLL